MTIAAAVSEARRRIAVAAQACGRDPQDIRLIAVTKSQAPEVLPQLAALGIHDYGENRLDHLALMQAEAQPTARFHAIGRVQGRQLADLVPRIACLHSFHDPGHLPRLVRACAGRQQPLPLFIQVQLDDADVKAGVAAADLPALITAVRAESCLTLLGLMGMAPDLSLPGITEDRVRAAFARARELAAEHGLSRLSLGMSGDFELAISYGATDLRLGSTLFAGPAT